MSDQQPPAVLAREARSIHQGLKELLKKKDPFDREVDFQRKNLRRRYLSLLLVHPYAKESHDAENHLWMQTSYLFISTYKQRISALDRILSQQQQTGVNNGSNSNGGHGPVEYRKLVQRFRQFLADEEKFWTKLVLRYRRSFALDEAHQALVKLGLILDSDDIDAGSEGRNHYQFPQESTPVIPTTPEQREGRLNIMSKALVCLGDIARYREVYNDGGGRSRIGHEDVPRRGRGRRGGVPGFDIVRPRNYTKARNCYEQAKLLFPTDGNPSHQLAILASYEKDQFISLVHYYFALCVKQPYDTASDNMGTIMSKALDQWKARSRSGRDRRVQADTPVAKVRIDSFKEKMVVLHALWRLGLEKMNDVMLKNSQEIYSDFKDLLSERQLPEEFIPQVLVTSQGALWTHRMIRDPHTKKQNNNLATTLSPSAVEAHIFSHLLQLYRALMEVGLKEINSVEVTDTDLAQRITAPFRRMLGAIRVSFKWLRANMQYVVDHRTHESDRFWAVLTDFSKALSKTFPSDQLPALTAVLEEDREMEGFLPLKGLFAKRPSSESAPDEHPNVVHLMRISDILEDAKLISRHENSPLTLNETGPPGTAFTSTMLPRAYADSLAGVKEEDSMTDATDPIADAFEHLNAPEQDLDDDDMEDDQVLYPRHSASPIPPVAMPMRQSPRTLLSPLKPSPLNLNPVAYPLSPVKAKSPRPATSTPTSSSGMTAQDLLFSDVLGGKRPAPPRNLPPPANRTIWSTASGELAASTGVSGMQRNQSPFANMGSIGQQQPTQVSWPPPVSAYQQNQNQGHSTQNSQSHPAGYSAPFAVAPQSAMASTFQSPLPPMNHAFDAPYMDRYPAADYGAPGEPRASLSPHYRSPDGFYDSKINTIGLGVPTVGHNQVHSRHPSLSLRDPRFGHQGPIQSMWGP